MSIIDIFNKIKKFLLFKIDDDSHEFRPILSEIEEQPINPLGLTIFWLIIIFIIIAGLWLYIGKVDVVITAQGVIIPDGEEKIVQSLDKGVVNKVFVNEGDYVKKGQTLAIISPAEYEPMLELNNLKAQEMQLGQQIAAARERLRTANDTKARLNSVLDIIPKARYDETTNEISSLTHEIGRLNASLMEVRNHRIQIEKQKQIIVSPVDGYICTVLIHTLGGVVTPAQELFSVVPKDAKLKIKATVMNKDIGFIKPQMPVSIKIDTFDFQKYGILNGTVLIVSPNSIKDEHLGNIYEVYIKPNNSTLIVEGKEEHIKVGMTTINEIKIGKRRIIEFFIYPLIKYLDESIKVR